MILSLPIHEHELSLPLFRSLIFVHYKLPHIDLVHSWLNLCLNILGCVCVYVNTNGIML